MIIDVVHTENTDETAVRWQTGMIARMCLNLGIEVYHRNLDGCQADNMF